MKQRIGFFGGSFNPPSKTHINLANKLLKENRVDKVVFVPVGDYYDKEELVEAKHRYNMLKLAIKDYDGIEIDDVELKINKRLYAVDIFKIIEEKYRDTDNYFIMGSDNYCKMPNWKNYKEIISKYKYIILDRVEDDISSSQIREMIRANKNTLEFLNKDVIEYIEKYELYK